jgi:hypothetical protein
MVGFHLSIGFSVSQVLSGLPLVKASTYGTAKDVPYLRDLDSRTYTMVPFTKRLIPPVEPTQSKKYLLSSGFVDEKPFRWGGKLCRKLPCPDNAIIRTS